MKNTNKKRIENYCPEEKLLEEWQERLGLQDWVIVLRCNCEFEDLTLEDAAGETEWTTPLKTATIRIIKPELDKDGIIPFDFENILVHELLHVKFSLIEYADKTYEGKVAAELRHQLIDDIARALVMAKRGERKRKLNCEKVIVK